MFDTHKSNEYIFPKRSGEMMSETSIKKKLSSTLNLLNKNLKEENKIKFTLHQLRHTYVCILHKAGIDIKQAQIWTGHKDVKVLLNIYTHLDAQDNQKSIAKVNQFLA
jgi:integrase